MFQFARDCRQIHAHGRFSRANTLSRCNLGAPQGESNPVSALREGGSRPPPSTHIHNTQVNLAFPCVSKQGRSRSSTHAYWTNVGQGICDWRAPSAMRLWNHEALDSV